MEADEGREGETECLDSFLRLSFLKIEGILVADDCSPKLEVGESSAVAIFNCLCFFDGSAW